MAKFLTTLKIENLDADNRWRTIAPLVFESDLIGRVEVKAGFCTDLATVYRVPIVYWLWGGRAHHESVIHDYLFRIGAVPNCSWEKANEVFLEAMTVRNKSPLVRYPMYWGVCIGSRHLWKRRGIEDDLSR